MSDREIDAYLELVLMLQGDVRCAVCGCQHDFEAPPSATDVTLFHLQAGDMMRKGWVIRSEGIEAFCPDHAPPRVVHSLGYRGNEPPKQKARPIRRTTYGTLRALQPWSIFVIIPLAILAVFVVIQILLSAISLFSNV